MNDVTIDNKALHQWLLEGDVAIQYQVYRDLLHTERNDLRAHIEKEGWGAEFLSRQRENGHWGRKFYQPKWISTHYTLLDLKNLNIQPDNSQIQYTLSMVLETEKGQDGGINPTETMAQSDVCVNGMVLNYASYFGTSEEKLRSIIDFLLSQHMKDGGFNCQSNMSGAVHSSLHSTVSVAEGIAEYAHNGYTYRLAELQNAEIASREFILGHRLYKSDKTGDIIDKKMLLLSYPCRWRYDILRALDYFQHSGTGYDSRMNDAIEVLMKKRRKDGTWPLQGKHPGQVHFDMEKPGSPSRWNTLRSLRVLKHFKI
jgi:hypothetical protein